jgi:porphobilinogen synthase
MRTIVNINQHKISNIKLKNGKTIKKKYGVDLHPSISHSTLREWQGLRSKLTKERLIYPLFIADDDNALNPIGSMPGQYQIGLNKLGGMLDGMVKDGLKSVIIFGVVSEKEKKDCKGSYADHEKSPVVRGVEFIKKNYPDLLVVVDVCMCQYTDHGHCGILSKSNKHIDNSESVKRLAEISLKYCIAGADVIAPSDMMDGRIHAIKTTLKNNDYRHIPVMSYSAKFASALYGPFRDAAHSTPSFGDRKAYQLPISSSLLPIRAIKRDLEEGADMIMVKPGGINLDIVKAARDICDVPIAAYQVSAEYAMIYHASKAGAFDLNTMIIESHTNITRAGADIIISYFTPTLLKLLK